MRILFISGELIAGDVALRLQQEGNDVRLFVQNETQKSCLGGLIEMTDDWRSELDWVGLEGVIVFDDVGYGAEQDRLRKAGYRVFGGSMGGDEIEIDRAACQKLFQDHGLNCLDTYNFESPADAADFIRGNRCAWVIKQNDHQSHINYVGKLDDGEDAIGLLHNYQRNGLRNLTLQRRVQGIEISVVRLFDGSDWVGPIGLTLEHKGLMNQEIGPKTGEMGTLMWYVDQCRLFDETLEKISPYLRSVNYRGMIDINCLVDGDVCYPIEVTSRLGCPAAHLQTALFNTKWSDIFYHVAGSENLEVSVKSDFGIILTIAVPPFPYTVDELGGLSSDGILVFFSPPLSEKEFGHLHLEGVSANGGQDGASFALTRSLGYAMFVSGIGPTVQEAQLSAYALANKIIIPKIMYRTDIGDRFINGDQISLHRDGWI